MKKFVSDCMDPIPRYGNWKYGF